MGDEINEEVIYKEWEEYGFDKSFREFFGGDGTLDKHKTKCLKNTLGYPHFKSGVWELQVTVGKQSFPVIVITSYSIHYTKLYEIKSDSNTAGTASRYRQ